MSAETSIAADLDFQVVGWNIESGQASPGTIAQQVTNDFTGIELWGFSEVQSDRVAELMELAAEEGEGTDMERIVGTTGRSDLLSILYDTGRFELLEAFELVDINIEGRVRAPLVAHLRGRQSGVAFFFMVNHLYRGDAQGRHLQSQMLNEWAAAQTDPVIAAGDYNYDWHVERGDQDHDAGYDYLTANGVFEWLRPEVMVTTHDSHYNSVLDFIFVAATEAQRQHWSGYSEVIVRDGDFPNTNLTSDHRPVFATFHYSPTERVVPHTPVPLAARNSGAARMLRAGPEVRRAEAAGAPAVGAAPGAPVPEVRLMRRPLPPNPTRNQDAGVEERLAEIERQLKVLLEEVSSLKNR